MRTIAITGLAAISCVIWAGPVQAQDQPGRMVLSDRQTGAPAPLANWQPGTPVQSSAFGDYPEPISAPDFEGASLINDDWHDDGCPACAGGDGSLWTDFALRRPCDPRWYLGGMVGVAVRDDESAHSPDTAVLIDYDNNAAGGGSVGYLFKATDHFQARLEGEFLHRHNGIESVLLNGVTQNDLGGESSTFSAMFNLVWDVDSDFWNWSPINRRLVPYFGLGVGVVHIDQDIRFNGNRMNDDDTVFGGQVLVGLSYRIKRDWEMFVDGRFLWAADPDFATTINGTSTPFKSDYQSQTVMFGMRFYFDNLPLFGPLWENSKGPGCDSAFRPDIVTYGGGR